jgi:uncharacterized membrane protein
MRSKFSIAGHPLHTMLVALPIGLFAWSFIALLIFIASDDSRSWYDVAYYSAVAGVVTALIAALPGFGDLVTMAVKNDRTKPLALAHMALNLSAVAVYAVVAVLMYDDGARSGGPLGAALALQIVGMAMLGLSGWLGGEMVYLHHLAVLPEAEHMPLAEQHRSPRLHPQARGR